MYQTPLYSNKTCSTGFAAKFIAVILFLIVNYPVSASLYTFSGNGNNNGIYGPIQKCDAKWIGQAMIYPSSGFNGGAGFGSITTVGFNVVGSGTSLSIPFKVYLKSVGATTTLSGTPTWASALAGATLVYSSSSPSSFAAGNWYDVTLSTPFTWSSGNLEVFVECDWGQVTGCGTSPVWAYNTATATDQEWNNNSSASALQTTAGLAVDQYRPDIRLNVSAPPPPPTISSFTPTSGCSASGTSVSITGTNFTGASNVSFNGTSAVFSVNSATQITATLPAGATTGTITVTTSGGTATSVGTFTVDPTPVATPTPSVQSVCSGATVNISLSSSVGGTTYSWSRNTPSGVSGTMPTSGSTDPSGTLINSSASAVTVTFTVIPSTSTCTGNAVTANVVVQPVPAQPGSISGSGSVCSGSNNTYSITSVSGATGYTWTLPNGWTGTSTTSSIATVAGSSGGTISVTADNSCGSSSPQILSVNMAAGPGTPGAISGPDSLCNSTTGTYSVGAVSGATSYTWTLPNGWTGTSTTNSISATAGSTGGTISVVANSSCGSSSAQTKAVSIASGAPALGSISGPTAICSGNSNTFSVVSVGATSYTWTLPNGWTGSSSTETISATAGSTGGTISVTANSTCGNSSPQTLSITITSVPATPGVISGPASFCSGSSNSYSIATVNGATGYTWTLPNGWTGSSASETISTVAGSSGGDIMVTADNACGSSSAQSLTVTFGAVPATPVIINGPNTICNGSTNTYSIATVNGATGYTWTLPNGWTGNSTTETISAVANSIGGDIMITADNACGSSAAQTLTVNIATAPATPSIITGSGSLCEGSLGIYSIATVNGATGYTWILPNGWSGTSATEIISATSGSTGGSISVTADNSCGSSAAQTISVTVNPLPNVSFNFTQNPVCSNASPVTLTGSPANGTFTGAGIAGSTFNPSLSGVGNVVITYSYTDGNNCTASDTSTIAVSICSGVDNVNDALLINVYPNPLDNGNWNLECGADLIGGKMEILDNNGRLIYKSEIRSLKTKLDLDASKGVYLMKISLEKKNISVKLIKL